MTEKRYRCPYCGHKAMYYRETTKDYRCQHCGQRALLHGPSNMKPQPTFVPKRLRKNRR